MATKEQSRVGEIEEWWALISRILAFFLGCVLGSILVLTENTNVWPYLLVIGLCGPTVAISVATVLEAAKGRVNGGK